MNKSLRFSLESILILLLALLLFTPGFYRNQWMAAGRKWFYDWQKNSEHMVIARLVESRQSGIFSHGALLGFGNIPTWSSSAENPGLEYQAYLEEGEFQSYFAYTSVPGIQGIFFSLFEQLTNFSPGMNLKIFHGVISLLSAFMLGLFVYWTSKELGRFAGLLTLLFIVFSEWITLFGGSIYWNLWAFYFPLIASSFYLMKNSSSEVYNHSSLGTLLAITMLIKCLFTGFEYITTALMMPLGPFIFYAIRDSWGWAKLIGRSLRASLGLLTGATVGLFILIWQITQVQGGVQEAVGTILHTLGRRSFGNPSQYTVEAESLNAALLPVLIKYINGRAILLSQILHTTNFSIEVSYLALFTAFLILTILLITIMKLSGYPMNRLTGKALIVTTWISAIAPISWFILFKSHSYIHTHLNYIIWQMPFTLYGFALCGYTIGVFMNLLSRDKYFRIYRLETS